MNAQETLRCLLDDLTKVWRVFQEDHLKEMPEIAIYYLLDNYDAIVFFIGQIYSKTDCGARQKLCDEHGELHCSAVIDGFGEIAVDALNNARDNRDEYRKLGYSLTKVSDDDLDVLLRVLKYAKFVPVDERDLELAHSPIENHGLTRRIGNFLSITEEEWRAVPWLLSDMLFAEHRKDAESQALALGLDLAHASVSDSSDIDSVKVWTDLLAELLEFKIECDWAAVMQVVKFEREKYVNVVVNRARSAELIGAFRKSLENWARRHSSEDPLGVAIRDSCPLIQRYEDLLSRVPNIQPRPDIYESMRKLRVPTQTVLQKVRGDLVMRDKNVIKGQGVIAPYGHVHDLNFSQLWNQSGQQIDLSKLAEELKSLREELRSRARAPEEDAAVGHLGMAEIEARNGDGPRTLEYLSKAGKWALEVATEIGTRLAAAAIGKAMALPG